MVKKSLKEKRHEARNYSIKEGVFATVRTSFGDRYIAPFAIAINTSSPLVAMLTSISGLLGPTTQLFSSKLLEKYTRKQIVTRAMLFESLMWLPLIAIAFLFYRGILVNSLPFLLLLSFGLYVILMNATSPAWFSWMGDIVDKKKRGRFFSKRNLILGFIAVVLAITASFFLDYAAARNWTMFGFMILFGLALMARLISRSLIKKQYEPKLKIEKSSYFSFWQFVKKAHKSNFGKFSIYRLFLTLTNTISTSLLAVYLLRNLSLKYSTYIIIILAGSVFSLVVMELLGKFADRYGNYEVIRISSILMPFLPILWILHPSPIYLVLVPAAVSGIAWAGYHLSEINFIYDNVSQQKRGIAVSYYNLFSGIGMFIGAGIGALLIKYLKVDFIVPIFAIFIMGAILRLFVVVIGLRKIREIRHTKKFKGIESIQDLISKEAKSTVHDEFHEITHIGKYLKVK